MFRKLHDKLRKNGYLDSNELKYVQDNLNIDNSRAVVYVDSRAKNVYDFRCINNEEVRELLTDIGFNEAMGVPVSDYLDYKISSTNRASNLMADKEIINYKYPEEISFRNGPTFEDLMTYNHMKGNSVNINRDIDFIESAIKEEDDSIYDYDVGFFKKMADTKLVHMESIGRGLGQYHEDPRITPEIRELAKKDPAELQKISKERAKKANILNNDLYNRINMYNLDGSLSTIPVIYESYKSNRVVDLYHPGRDFCQYKERHYEDYVRSHGAYEPERTKTYDKEKDDFDFNL